MVIDLCISSISSCSDAGLLYFARNLSILSRFSNLLDIRQFIIFIYLEIFLTSVVIFSFLVYILFICNCLLFSEM